MFASDCIELTSKLTPVYENIPGVADSLAPMPVRVYMNEYRRVCA